MFGRKKQNHGHKDRLDRMQDLYKSITNANWTAASMEQNGHYRQSLQCWKDLTIYADDTIESLNKECSGANLSHEEKLTLDELNKLRAEIESNYQMSSKAMDEYIDLKAKQARLQLEELQLNRQQEQQYKQEQQLQQQQQQQSNTSVPTLRTSIPHTLNTSRKTGSKMLKSLRPGGLSSTTMPSASKISSQASNILTETSSAKHAANMIWAPSNSLNLVPNNDSNSSVNKISSLSTNNSLESPEISSSSNIYLSQQQQAPQQQAQQQQSQSQQQLSYPKRQTSDRTKKALQASAAVKYPNRPDGGRIELSQKYRQQSQNRFKSYSNSNSNSKSNSQSPSQSPIRSTPIQIKSNKNNNEFDEFKDFDSISNTQELNKDDNIVKNVDIEEDEKTQEEKETESILKKIKGVDLKFAKNILIESNRDQDKVYWSDIAGLEQAKESLMETVVYPFLRPDLFRGLREPVSGMLLFGPPGTGKTMLARAAATESNSTFFSIQSSSLTSKWYGESEKLVRALFQVAKAKAPSIIFVDEIDSLLGKRSGDGDDDTSRRLKNEFLVQWSDLSKAAAGRMDDNDEPPARVLVLAATNLPWGIDEAARRRFVRRQYIPLPEPETRLAHFKKLLENTPNSLNEEDMNELVKITDGYSGSDITSLAKDAAIWPIRELGSKMLNLKEIEIRPMSLGDFKKSMKNIRPSVNKEGLEKFEQWAKEFGSSGA